jgi:hypothetical protein
MAEPLDGEAYDYVTIHPDYVAIRIGSMELRR